MPQPFKRNDVNLSVLRDELSEALGVSVELSVIPKQTVTEQVMEDIMQPVVVAELVDVTDDSGTTYKAMRARETDELQVVGHHPTGEERKVELPGEIYIHSRETGEELDVDTKLVASVIKKHNSTPDVVVPALTNNEILRLRALLG